MRMLCDFNQDWLFIDQEVDDQTGDDRFERVSLPHSNKMFSSRFVDHADYEFVSTYRKRFMRPPESQGKRVFIDFDGVMLVSSVFLNGEAVGVHRGGYTPFSFDVTDYLVDSENLLTVYVDSTENPSVPPFGGLVDYLTFGGIYREVFLRVVDVCHIRQVIVRTHDVLTSPRIESTIHLSDWKRDSYATTVLRDGTGKLIAESRAVVDNTSVSIELNALDNIDLWTLERPTLYTLDVTLEQDGEIQDQYSVRFGFRTAEFQESSFYLNGAPLKLFGLNRHQTFPYIGAAAPKHLQELDADIIKHELGCNIVRTSHYPQSPHFLNRCDEIGLLVFEEIAGWQHIGDEAWQALALDDLRGMIRRDQHHPSIILWGVRINESPDHTAFYECTNAVARELDPTRQTGGVRNFIQSELLEDVFTLNDFPAGIQTSRGRPHMITEYAGHMFPTKTWDHEERRIEHALHHANKQNLQMGHPDVTGAIGWCAFDYYTHKEFGSGDRVCYHGVMDVYRLPKFAAYFYRSQKSPTDEVVLQAATNWTMGDRSGGGNNPLTVFSNCDEIDIYIGEQHMGRLRPDTQHYPHLPHPPFTLRWQEPYDPWGTPFHDLKIIGYLNGKAVITRQIDVVQKPHQIRLMASTDRLKANGADLARLAVQIIDNHDNVLPYQMRTAQFSIEGEADLIGENPLVLLGGQAACFVKSRFTKGTNTIHASVEGLPSAAVSLHID